MKIKSQPLLRWLYYPAATDMKTVYVHKDIAAQFIKLKGTLGKPVFLTRTFVIEIIKTSDAFRKIYPEAIATYEGKSGVLVTNRLYADDSCTGEDAQTIVWTINGGVLSFVLFGLLNGQSMNYAWASSTFYEDGWWDCDWRSVRYPHLDPDVCDRMVDQLCHCATLFIVGYLCLYRWAKVELIDIKPNKTVRIKGEKEPISLSGDVPMTIMDCRWFREISSDKEFAVSGHFRLQPFKNDSGVWDKKLIYINEYIKHGYHRKAGIQMANEDKKSAHHSQIDASPGLSCP